MVTPLDDNTMTWVMKLVVLIVVLAMLLCGGGLCYTAGYREAIRDQKVKAAEAIIAKQVQP